MLLALGMFVFEMSTALYDELSRSAEWRHGATERFGAMPASQYLGPGKENITLTGSIVPEITGTTEAFKTLRAMADKGDSNDLVDGLGNVMGAWVIAKLDTHQQYLLDNGVPRATGFTLELERVK